MNVLDMRFSYKNILILVLLLLCVIGIVSIRRTELILNFRIEDRNYQASINAEAVEISGYVISLLFRRYFVQGTATIGIHSFKIDQLTHVGTPRDKEHIYMLTFKPVDNYNVNRYLYGEMSLTGDVMQNIVVRYSDLHIYDFLLNRTISYELYLLE